MELRPVSFPWCLVDLVPDLIGLVKDAWLGTDFGFPLLSLLNIR